MLLPRRLQLPPPAEPRLRLPAAHRPVPALAGAGHRTHTSTLEHPAMTYLAAIATLIYLAAVITYAVRNP
jgi:hypothetical protein